MKKLFLAAFAVFAFTSVNAQDFGVFANYASNSFDGGDSTSGFNIGVLAGFEISEKFSVQPELLYSAQGAKEDGGDGELKLDYINIPVMAKFYVAEGFSLEAGPQVGFLMSAKSEGGGESVEALKSKNNVFKIGDAIKLNQDLYAVYNSNLNFAPRLGIPVHGIIGFDLFKDLIVEVNYSAGYLKLMSQEKFKYKDCKKCERLNLEFYNGKPYINAKVKINNNEIPVKLLIDSGGSDALWLFEDDSLNIKPGDKFFNDFLGHGLNGSVYGKRSKVQSIAFKNFVLKNANVAYPNIKSIFFAKQIKDRNGSIAGNILKRFNIIFDYRRALITLTKNNKFNEKFSYNKSGIELAHDGMRILRELKKSNIKENSSNQSSNNSIILENQYKILLKISNIKRSFCNIK